METLAAQPRRTETYDQHERGRNDTETWLAEVLDGSMRTSFEYSSDGYELYAQDGGTLGSIFEDAIVDAQRLSRQDPALAFELRRRKVEADEYREMLAMARGALPNTMVVVSDFPQELMHATHDVGGYNVSRKITMLRVITYAVGRIHMYSQSLDRSDRRALESIYARFGMHAEPGELLGQRIHVDIAPEDQPYVIDELSGVYDHSLAEQYGGRWHDGRRDGRYDTYGFVKQQSALIDHLIELEMTKGISAQDRYNVAALLTKRFEAHKNPVVEIIPQQVVMGAMIQNIDWQLRQAGNEARIQGRTFSGCGVSIASDRLSAGEQLGQSGYGNQTEQKEDEDKFGPLEFKCKNGHTNRRPRGKLIKHCHVAGCVNSVAC